MKIAVDIFGGDHAPEAVLQGCVDALFKSDECQLLLFGDEKQITEKLSQYRYDKSRMHIMHAPDIITTHEAPVQAIKTKKTSSLVCALNSVASKEAEVMVSAGSTGAVLAGATLIVKRIRGIKRAALAPVMPAANGGGVLLIDCGANVDSKPEFLQQFAIMGSIYMNCLFGIETPRVGLINNGAEPEKGDTLTVAAHQLLLNTPVHFVGNAEARDIYSGAFDVVVADGFVGNVLLKATEGIAAMLFGMVRDEMMGSFRTKMGALLSKPAFRRVKKKLDYTEYGGALLLGIDGGIIKAHGSSNAKAICSTILQAERFAKAGVVRRIKQQISQLPSEES